MQEKIQFLRELNDLLKRYNGEMWVEKYVDYDEYLEAEIVVTFSDKTHIEIPKDIGKLEHF